MHHDGSLYRLHLIFIQLELFYAKDTKQISQFMVHIHTRRVTAKWKTTHTCYVLFLNLLCNSCLRTNKHNRCCKMISGENKSSVEFDGAPYGNVVSDAVCLYSKRISEARQFTFRSLFLEFNHKGRRDAISYWTLISRKRVEPA